MEEVCTDDPSAVSDAQALVGTLENFEFIVGMVIWHDVLFSINMVSKKLQSKIVCRMLLSNKLKGLSHIFKSIELKASTLVLRLQKPLQLIWI